MPKHTSGRVQGQDGVQGNAQGTHRISFESFRRLVSRGIPTWQRLISTARQRGERAGFLLCCVESPFGHRYELNHGPIHCDHNLRHAKESGVVVRASYVEWLMALRRRVDTESRARSTGARSQTRAEPEASCSCAPTLRGPSPSYAHAAQRPALKVMSPTPVKEFFSDLGLAHDECR